MSRQPLKLFMVPEITSKRIWFEFDTNCGLEILNPDILPIQVIEDIKFLDDQNNAYNQKEFYNLIKDYINGTEVYNFNCTNGYGCRTSARGYLDCTDWSVYNTKKECYNYLAEMLDLSVSSVRKYTRELL